MAAGRIYPSERQAARLQNRRIKAIFMRAIQASLLTLVHARQEALRALRSGGDPVIRARASLHELQSVVQTAMLNAHLLGVVSSTQVRRRKSSKSRSSSVALQHQDFEGSVEFFRRRARLTLPQVEALESLYGPRAVHVVDGLDRAVDRKLQQAMTTIRSQNLHVRQGVKVLKDAFDLLGLSPENRFTLEGIYRTQTQLALSAGQRQAERDPIVQEILWGYKYITVGDDRVRASHEALEGVTLPKDDPHWDTIMPPNGWACRCTVIPIFEERKAVEVPAAFQDSEGRTVVPGADRGFEFNPGNIASTIGV